MDSKRIKILLIEDNPGDIRLIKEQLTETAGNLFDLVVADSLAVGLEHMAVGLTDVVLLDLSLPDSEGLTTFTRARTYAPRVPIVVLTGQANEELALEALRQGAQDYLVKGDVDMRSRVRAVRYAIQRKHTEAALQTSDAKFRELFERVAEGVYQSSPDGKLLTANPALVQMLGYEDEAELLALDVGDLYMDPEDRTLWEQEAKTQGELRNIEVALKHRDGQKVIVLANARAVRNEKKEVLYYEGTLTNITERKYYEDQLAHLANYDSLTHLYNRRRFEEELEQQLAQVRRYKRRGALLWLDLDQFKDINDSFGHRAGNELLVDLASLLQAQLREADIIARLGGDEFGILLLEVDADQAQAFAARLLEEIRNHTVVIKGQPIRVTTSIGIAPFSGNATPAEDLLAHADLAMYRAKDEGRNRFSVYAPDKDWQAALESRVTWARRIREALEEDRFLLYAQPILELKNNYVSRYELLLRMATKRKGVTSPGAFLDVAERFGLSQDIDRWVACQAIRLLEKQREAGRDVCLEVNLSGKALADNRLLALIESELNMTKINPACLVWEITETIAISDIRRAKQFIGTLKGMGCQFALDDFGIGFSSFYHLKHLPVDYLKIDGSFIHNLPHDPVDQRLVQAMVQVAQGLGKKTIAEFVENEQTLQLLQEYGVDYTQGYHIGRPCPLSEAL